MAEPYDIFVHLPFVSLSSPSTLWVTVSPSVSVLSQVCRHSSPSASAGLIRDLAGRWGPHSRPHRVWIRQCVLTWNPTHSFLPPSEPWLPHQLPGDNQNRHKWWPNIKAAPEERGEQSAATNLVKVVWEKENEKKHPLWSDSAAVHRVRPNLNPDLW